MTVKRAISFFVNLAFNVVALILLYYFVVTLAGRFFNIGKEVANDISEQLPPMRVTIDAPANSDISEIAKILEDEGIIKNALLFQLECLLKGNGQIFEGGEVTLDTSMSTNEIIYALLEKPVFSNDIAITIREGFTVKEIAMYLESKDIVDAEEFIKACNESELNFSFLDQVPLRENRLEGYLFPDTYYIAENTTPEAIISKMLVRFDEIYSQYSAAAVEAGLTMDEVITMASIVEKEISVAEERPMAAQVIYNRLDDGHKLEMCSTVLYILDKRKDRLYETDLQVESPYNTYLNPGLPHGPISNPGEACIKAVLNPSGDNYMYFVVKDEETGEHFFTDDYNAFLNAKDVYNQKF